MIGNQKYERQTVIHPSPQIRSVRIFCFYLLRCYKVKSLMIGIYYWPDKEINCGSNFHSTIYSLVHWGCMVSLHHDIGVLYNVGFLSSSYLFIYFYQTLSSSYSFLIFASFFLSVHKFGFRKIWGKMPGKKQREK